MPSFSGKYYYTLDPKGRIIIPASFREIISANYSPKLYIADAAFDRCLHLYPLEEWNKLEEKVRAMPKMDEAVKFFMRRVIASAVETDIDKQGRVLVPVAHREDAGLNGEIVIVGQLDRIDIWDRKEWDATVDLAGIDKKAFEERLVSYGL
ncbi:MAG: division/cell wall cluster transcriptional repressor MraZ [Nitrospirae bacterium]|nr:division/cell wall cluster transcriptional repressor MraZ [Nitrospirota bacterium]